MRTPFFFLVLLALALLGACAKVGRPQGGAVDKELPRILGHAPARDALRVPLDTALKIVFSEAMDHQRTEEAIFVSPAGPLRYRWRGQTLHLELALRSERTYVITVGTGARDLRGNALEQSFSLAFATGAHLNQGTLVGHVYKDHEPARAAHVWAYDLAHFSGGLGDDSPAYQTQSGTDGSYEFLRLAAGSYRLLAFVDEDRDQRPGVGEWVALPAADMEVDEVESRAGDLLLVRRRQTSVELQRIQVVHSTALLLLFSNAVDPDSLKLHIPGLDIGALYSGEDRRKVYASTAEQEVGRSYVVEHITLGGIELQWDEPVRGSGRSDRKAPEWNGLDAERLAPDESVQLLFNEAMDTDISAGLWAGSDSVPAPLGRWHWRDHRRVVFTPDEPWVLGQQTLQINGVDLTDRAGNALADSSLAASFEVVDPSAALRGQWLGAVGVLEVRARGEDGRFYTVTSDSVGRFAIEHMLPGTYTLWAFADSDGDGTWSAGSLLPFVRPEIYMRLAESIKLQAFQIVDDIELEMR
jgi:uncharacterized protein (DUF2141 family)